MGQNVCITLVTSDFGAIIAPDRGVQHLDHYIEKSKMRVELSEEEMRQALFGSSTQSDPQPPPKRLDPGARAKSQASSKSRSFAKSVSQKLRVMLHVTKDFEGDVEVFIYDANTLSTLVAEQEAKNEAKKKKFRYFEVISVKPVP